MKEGQQVGTLVITTKFENSGERVPKEVQVFNPDFSIESSQWVYNNEWSQVLSTGIYVVRVNLAPDVQLNKIAEINPDQDTVLSFYESDIRQSRDRMTTTMRGPAVKSTSRKSGNKNVKRSISPDSAQVTLVLRQQGFAPSPIPGSDTTKTINSLGETFSFSPLYESALLSLQGYNTREYLISVPPGDPVTGTIRLTGNFRQLPYGLEVSLQSSNKTAQTLLTLMTTGDIAKAKSLSRTEEAERLLFDKMEDPASAAIGGYYLLRVRELERLHDWANNLANRFPWMPDGAIIHAWQMIQQQKLNTFTADKITTRLIEAMMRGIPIYTEGLRLLYEGLVMCSYHFKKDTQINSLLQTLKSWYAYADMSRETTTFSFPVTQSERFSSYNIRGR